MRLLAILDRPETAQFTLQAAGELARRLNGQEILLLHPKPMTDPAFQAPDEGIPTPNQRNVFAKQVATRAARLHAMARDWISRTDPRTAAHVHWTEINGDIRRIVAQDARHADLVIVSRPSPHDRDDVGQALSGALYDAAATVLIAPLQACPTVGRRPIVAWYPSPALDRTLNMARPLLETAEHVTILIGEENGHTQPPPPLAQILIDRGVPVTIDRFPVSYDRLGQEIRTHALAARGDLLIMGAYTHSRFVEWLFGGPTRDLLAHATLPILTRHPGREDHTA